MNKLISIIVVALASVGMVEAKHEDRPVSHPVMHPIAFPTDVRMERPNRQVRRHVRPHRHHVRHCQHPHRCRIHRPSRRSMVRPPFVRPNNK
jgi:hypothetical protein